MRLSVYLFFVLLLPIHTAYSANTLQILALAESDHNNERFLLRAHYNVN